MNRKQMKVGEEYLLRLGYSYTYRHRDLRRGVYLGQQPEGGLLRFAVTEPELALRPETTWEPRRCDGRQVQKPWADYAADELRLRTKAEEQSSRQAQAIDRARAALGPGVAFKLEAQAGWTDDQREVPEDVGEAIIRISLDALERAVQAAVSEGSYVAPERRT